MAYTLIIEKINSMYEENNPLLVVTAISSVFVILTVCIGFHYIIRNTIVIRELEKDAEYVMHESYKQEKVVRIRIKLIKIQLRIIKNTPSFSMYPMHGHILKYNQLTCLDIERLTL